MPSTTDVLISSVFKKELGLEPITVQQINGRGATNQVFKIDTAAGQFALRLNQKSHFPDYQKEAWCLEHASRQGVPVPVVLACGIEAEHSYSIARWIDSLPATTKDVDRLTIWNKLGEYARKINAAPVDGSGFEMSSANQFTAKWKEFIEARVACAFGDKLWQPGKLLKAEQLEQLKELMLSTSKIVARSGICITDIMCENAVIENQTGKIYVLDLEYAAGGPVPHYQLAFVGKGFGINPAVMQAFTDGYGLTQSEMIKISKEVKALTALEAMLTAQWHTHRHDFKTFLQNALHWANDALAYTNS